MNFAKHLLHRTRLGDCFWILILCLEIPFSKNLCHIETSQAISKANKLTGFYMIQVFTKRFSQTVCSIFLKILYSAPGSSKEFCANMGFSFKVKFTVYNAPWYCSSALLFLRFFILHTKRYKEVDNKSQNYRQSNNSMLKLWCLFLFLLQIILK